MFSLVKRESVLYNLCSFYFIGIQEYTSTFALIVEFIVIHHSLSFSFYKLWEKYGCGSIQIEEVLDLELFSCWFGIKGLAVWTMMEIYMTLEL